MSQTGEKPPRFISHRSPLRGVSAVFYVLFSVGFIILLGATLGPLIFTRLPVSSTGYTVTCYSAGAVIYQGKTDRYPHVGDRYVMVNGVRITGLRYCPSVRIHGEEI